jgi:hypothetical protein
MKIKSLWFMSIAAILLAGCSSTPPVPNPGPGPDKNDDDDDDDKSNLKKPTVEPGSAEIVAAVSSFFRDKCVDCHGGAKSLGDLGDLFNVQGLRDKRLIGEKADDSVLFTTVKGLDHQEGQPNPRTGQKAFLPNEQDINFLQLWLDSGAPDLRGNRTGISISDYLEQLRLGISRLNRPVQAQTVVIDFRSVFNNNRFSDAELDSFANATIKLLNELDVRSGSLNQTGAALIRDLDANRPLAIIFNADSFGLDKQQDIIDTIVRLDNRQDPNDIFECDVPTIPVLDFIQIAAADDFFNPILEEFDSGYSNIAIIKLLEDAGFAQKGDKFFNPIPAQQFIANGFTNIANFNLFQLLEAVDPNTLNRPTLDALYNDASEDERIIRGCMLNSNVSGANRCIDRYTTSRSFNTSAWISWDILSFENAGDQKDFLAAGFVGPNAPANDPLLRDGEGLNPFKIDGGELIFNLKNQMMGFAVFNGNFQVLSDPPTQAVLNLDNIERGSEISVNACTYCHAAYTIPFVDIMFPTIIEARNGFTPEEVGFAFKLGESQDKLDSIFGLDAQDYTEALRRIYFTKGINGDLGDGIWTLGKQYNNDLTIEDAAAELGFSRVESLQDAIDNDTNLLGDLPGLATGAGVSRENFTRQWAKLVRQVSLGNEDYLFGCLQRVVSDAGDVGVE